MILRPTQEDGKSGRLGLLSCISTQLSKGSPKPEPWHPSPNQTAFLVSAQKKIDQQSKTLISTNQLEKTNVFATSENHTMVSAILTNCLHIYPRFSLFLGLTGVRGSSIRPYWMTKGLKVKERHGRH